MSIDSPTTRAALTDRFGRKIDYLRISVTDRCDFRCVYCMGEDMRFLPRESILSLEEIEQVAGAFVALGVRKIRITGGEPLVRKGVLGLFERISAMPGLDELVMTTNGSQLERFAEPLKNAGVKRLNISLDSLDEERFRQLTRTGRLGQVVAGIQAACAAGFDRIKLNSVILKGRNDDEVLGLVAFAREHGVDISFIEEMPLGSIVEHQRNETFCSSDEVRAQIESRYPLTPMSTRTAGPSRYFQMAGHRSRIGFISPHSHNFCGDCNRVRLTAEGRLLLCLGNEHSVDLRALVRRYPGDVPRLEAEILKAIELKPREHEFQLDEEPQILRFMNMTGG